MDDISAIYTKTFLTNSGKQVLEHLRKITIERTLGPNSTESELRSLEAQRMLVHQIENFVQRGRL